MLRTMRGSTAFATLALTILGCAQARVGGVPAPGARVLLDTTWTAFTVPGTRAAAIADSSTDGLVVTLFHWAATHNDWKGPKGISAVSLPTQDQLMNCVQYGRIANCVEEARSDDTTAANRRLQERLEHDLDMEPFDFFSAVGCTADTTARYEPPPPPTNAGGDQRAEDRRPAVFSLRQHAECALDLVGSSTVARVFIRRDTAVANVIVEGNRGEAIELDQYCVLAVRRSGSWSVVRGHTAKPRTLTIPGDQVGPSVQSFKTGDGPRTPCAEGY